MSTDAEQALTPEQTAQSIEDRLAGEFEQAEPQARTKAATPEKTTDNPDREPDVEGDGLEEVEYDGETFRVPTKLKEAIIHKADYTQKTQAVAEKQRNIELQSEQIRIHNLEREFNQTISEPLNSLNLIESRTKLLLNNWEKLSAEEKQEILYLDKQKEAFSREIESKRNEFNVGLQKSLAELRSKALETVKKAIPGWNETLAKEITEHAVSDGYTNQELSSITDPRHLKTLWKAREYDKLKAKAVATPAKVTQVKPGASNPMTPQVKDKLAFRKEMDKASTPTQKARLIEERFAKQFGG